MPHALQSCPNSVKVALPQKAGDNLDGHGNLAEHASKGFSPQRHTKDCAKFQGNKCRASLRPESCETQKDTRIFGFFWFGCLQSSQTSLHCSSSYFSSARFHDLMVLSSTPAEICLLVFLLFCNSLISQNDDLASKLTDQTIAEKDKSQQSDRAGERKAPKEKEEAKTKVEMHLVTNMQTPTELANSNAMNKLASASVKSQVGPSKFLVHLSCLTLLSECTPLKQFQNPYKIFLQHYLRLLPWNPALPFTKSNKAPQCFSHLSLSTPKQLMVKVHLNSCM